MLRKVMLVVLAGAAVVAFAAPASAIDLTGQWVDAKSTCRQLLATGEVVKFKDDAVVFDSMDITHFGDGSLNVAQGVFAFRGFAYSKGSNPTTGGEGLIEKCDNPSPGTLVSWKITSAKTFPPNSEGVTGVMKVEHLLANGISFDICKVRFDRTSTSDPNVPACP